MNIEELLAEKPAFHVDGQGGAANYAADEFALRFIAQHATADMVTLETGTGQSTVAFAIAGSDHTSISPAKDEHRRILDYCSSKGTGSRLRFLADASDHALATGEGVPNELDFVFIDGAHRFPIPIIDWHYTDPRLKVGGILGVDDIQMPSVNVLCDFLRNEAEWELLDESPRTVFFRKVRKVVPVLDWQGQAMNAPHRWPRAEVPRPSLPRRIKRRIREWLSPSGPR
jgi:hypothetical protein